MQYHAIIILCLLQIKNIVPSEVNISSLCEAKSKRCIWKCCPVGQYVKRRACVPSNIIDTPINLTVYDVHLQQTDLLVEDVFELVPGIMSNEGFKNKALNLKFFGNLYVVQDGNLYVEMANMFDRWLLINTDDFCVDLRVIRYNKIAPVIMGELKDDNYIYDPYLRRCSLIVSIVFLVLTILPYAIFSHLRDMNGVILILFAVFFVIPMIVELFMLSNLFSKIEALVIAICYYFFMISSFCWTNIMFYRLRWSRDIVELNKVKTFLIYVAYSIGLPLILTIMMPVTELNADNLSQTPWFVTPQLFTGANFSFKTKESLFYLHIPLILLLTFNWTVTIKNLMEFYQNRRTHSIAELERDNTGLESPLNRPTRYIALLVILTSYCLVQITAMFCKNSSGDLFLDIYIMCLGTLIFITFVFHKNLPKITKNFCTKLKAENLAVIYKKDNNKPLK